MTKTPLVSVIMTVYNGEQFLAQAIESIRQQSLQKIELVIVDDGSDDRTPEILAEAQASDPRIRVITKPRIGRARALNVAWRQAKGRYIANLDADDMAEPERLEKQAAFLQQHPEVGLLGTGCRFIYEGYGDTEKKQQRHPPVSPPTGDVELRRLLVRYNPFVHSSIMMPRYVLEQVGGYNESLRIAIDYELWVCIASHHFKLANLPNMLTVRRLRPQSYFHSKISLFEGQKSKLMIRWYAWRNLSRNIANLSFVFSEPIERLYDWAKRLIVQ